MVIKAKKQAILCAIVRYGTSQKVFAERIGISYIHFNKILNGHASPSTTLSKKVTDELQKEFDELFIVEESTTLTQN